MQSTGELPECPHSVRSGIMPGQGGTEKLGRLFLDKQEAAGMYSEHRGDRESLTQWRKEGREDQKRKEEIHLDILSQRGTANFWFTKPQSKDQATA